MRVVVAERSFSGVRGQVCFFLFHSVGLQTEQAMRFVCQCSSLQTYVMKTAGSDWLISFIAKFYQIKKNLEEEQVVLAAPYTNTCYPFSITLNLTE